MIYSVRHTTTFRYEPPVRESVMEVRLHPRSDGDQRCLNFSLEIDPAANVLQYRDFIGNAVHHFDIAGAHTQLKITAKSEVEVHTVPPPRHSDAGDWSDLDALVSSGDHWEMLLPSHYAHSTALLEALERDLLHDVTNSASGERRLRPFDLLTRFNQAIFGYFAYVPNSTHVDSPIDEAIEARKGVCQDFAHILLALARRQKIPARYVSGYMFHRDEKQKDRSLDGASHAWIEALVPGLGWTAFDPTNNLVGADRHIRVALGRDYADVPPTRGVYKGEAQSELSVSVSVSSADHSVPESAPPAFIVRPRPPLARKPTVRIDQEKQQQQ